MVFILEVLRRSFEELAVQWPVNADEIEKIREHLLQHVTENGYM